VTRPKRDPRTKRQLLAATVIMTLERLGNGPTAAAQCVDHQSRVYFRRMKKIDFRIDVETYRALVKRARRKRTSMSAIVRQAIRDGLARDAASAGPR
jgi:Ribbon-helix-helix protein, copG family